MALLKKKLTKEWADEVLHEDVKLLLAVIHDLHHKGKELGKGFEGKTYGDLAEFYKDHDGGNSPLCQLEGKSERAGNLFLLKSCPMMDLLEASSEGGQLPAHFDMIVEKWKNLYKKQGAVLHPYCIVHQVIRTTVGEAIVAGGKKLRVVQIACRSTKSGVVACADEGLNRYNLSREDVAKRIAGHACMYAVE